MNSLALKKQMDEIDNRSGQRVRAIVFKASGDAIDPGKAKEKVPHSKSLPDDAFESLAQEILDPPYDPRRLLLLSEWSTALSSCGEAMEVNVPGFGNTITAAFPQDPPADLKDEVRMEELALKNDLSVLARGKSLTKWRRQDRRDRTFTGNSYVEVIRSSKGEWVAVKRLKSYRMRLLRQDRYLTEYEIKAPQAREDGTVEYIKIPDAKRFRRFVEAISGTSPNLSSNAVEEYSYRYYKEYGDPRVLDNESGEYVDKEKQDDFDGEGNEMPDSRKASEVYHFGDSDRSPYGIPGWISALASVLGTRSGELVNLHTLENNGVPSMVVTVSNGRLTEDTIERIQQFVDNHVKGNANYSTFLVMEGEGDIEGDETNHVKINITPLADTQVRDMLFGEYIEKNERRVAQAFRIAPIYLGAVGQYNKATADISRRLTDEQVFAPERDEDDWWFNTVLFSEWEIKYHKFITNTPNITDSRDLIAMGTALERTGAMTPRIGREIAREVFPKLAQFLAFGEKGKDTLDPDMPFSLTMAERIKNQALPTEVGQQVAPVMPAAEPDSVMAAYKMLLKQIDGLEEAAEAELNRYLAMERIYEE
jgi:PBSX family phage portal protein